jgi:ATP-dependent protease HslVU (ClpYQ) peptidase subunit
MTCIVGLKQDGKVYIGGDSLGSNLYKKVIRADQKIFVKNDMIFGFTSSFRMGQILQYSFNPPKRLHEDDDDMRYLVDKFIPSLIQCYESKGFLAKKDGVAIGGVFLLGYKERLFKIESDFQVGESTDTFDACGCGEDFALGSMFSTVTLENPETRINIALDAAAEFSPGVGGPSLILSI